jgi:hypothetical protein
MKTLPISHVNLKSAQDWAWASQKQTPETASEALGRLYETVRLLLRTFEDAQLLKSQSLLEDSLLQTLVAMRSLSMDPDAALNRGLQRLRCGNESERAFHIFSDHVEIRVHGESRGQWPLYSQGDYDAAISLARDLGCDIVHEDACQLGLFE